MPTSGLLSGVYVAAVTPLHATFSPDPAAIAQLLEFYAHRGCHGALLFGTTGEGPSFAPAERIQVWRAAVLARQQQPELRNFRLLGGAGTPSLDETIQLTRSAFDLGLDGVVTLPPYYFRKASDDGLFAWYAQVIQRSVPSGSPLLAYHFPSVSGVPLSLDLLARLLDAFPNAFAGLKDSSGDPEYGQQLGARFGRSLAVFTGNDRLLSAALNHQASGCITAMANLFSPLLRQVWDRFQAGQPDPAAQSQLSALRTVLDGYAPAPAILKPLLARWHNLPRWALCPPLLALPEERVEQASQELQTIIHAADGRA